MHVWYKAKGQTFHSLDELLYANKYAVSFHNIYANMCKYQGLTL